MHPDLELHCARVNDAEKLILKPAVYVDELVKLAKEGIGRFDKDAAMGRNVVVRESRNPIQIPRDGVLRSSKRRAKAKWLFNYALSFSSTHDRVHACKCGGKLSLSK